MILTESEAKTKWCPFARVRDGVDPVAINRLQAMPPNAARCIAAATFFALRKVTAQMVDPEPLKNAPSAPAFSAAATTRGRRGISLARNGW